MPLLHEPSESELLQQLHTTKDNWQKFEIGRELAARDFDRYGQQVLTIARVALADAGCAYNHESIAVWMLDHFDAQVVTELTAYLRQADAQPFTWKDAQTGRTHQFTSPYCRQQIVIHAVELLGNKALPVVMAGCTDSDSEMRMVSFCQLLQFNDDACARDIIDLFAVKICENEPYKLARFLQVITKVRHTSLLPQISPLLRHKTKTVRDAAVAAVAALAEDIMPEARLLLAEQQSELRCWSSRNAGRRRVGANSSCSIPCCSPSPYAWCGGVMILRRAAADFSRAGRWFLDRH